MTRPLITERLHVRGPAAAAGRAFRRDTGGTFVVVRPGTIRAAAKIRRDTVGTFVVVRPRTTCAEIRRNNRHPSAGTPQVLRLRPDGLGHEARTGHPPPAPHAISP
jgi:hypothetical protein